MGIGIYIYYTFPVIRGFSGSAVLSLLLQRFILCAFRVVCPSFRRCGLAGRAAVCRRSRRCGFRFSFSVCRSCFRSSSSAALPEALPSFALSVVIPGFGSFGSALPFCFPSRQGRTGRRVRGSRFAVRFGFCAFAVLRLGGSSAARRPGGTADGRRKKEKSAFFALFVGGALWPSVLRFCIGQ